MTVPEKGPFVGKTPIEDSMHLAPHFVLISSLGIPANSTAAINSRPPRVERIAASYESTQRCFFGVFRDVLPDQGLAGGSCSLWLMAPGHVTSFVLGRSAPRPNPPARGVNRQRSGDRTVGASE